MLNYVDETEMEEQGVGDLLLDENTMASAPRPGTSFSAPATRSVRSNTTKHTYIISVGTNIMDTCLSLGWWRS